MAGALKAGPALLFGSTCEAATHLAGRLGYGPGVVTALGPTFERFDGKGWPGTLRGEAIPLAAQIAMITDDLGTLAALGDLTTARAEIARRAGSHYDPSLVRALDRIVADVLAEFDGADAWAVAASHDPAPDRKVADVTATLLVVADLVDIKVPGMAGHSRAVAELADIVVDDVRPLAEGLIVVEATQTTEGPLPPLHITAIVGQAGESAEILECRPYMFLPLP